MKKKIFAGLLKSANEALEHAQGKRSLRTATLPLPPRPMNRIAVRRIRSGLHVSQAVLARYLNVSTKLVQAWEAGRRKPEGPALVLLHMMHPAGDFDERPWQRLRGTARWRADPTAPAVDEGDIDALK